LFRSKSEKRKLKPAAEKSHKSADQFYLFFLKLTHPPTIKPKIVNKLITAPNLNDQGE